MLSEKEIRTLVSEYGSRVNEGRPIKKLLMTAICPVFRSVPSWKEKYRIPFLVKP